MLLLSDPFTGAQNVALNSDVTFTFLSAMAPVQKVDWSANVSAANFSYSWSADGKTLTCVYNGDFPPSATITWTLDPAVFKDQNGGALLPFNNSGSFTTGSGQSNPNDPCNGETGDPNTGGLSIFKSVQYIQNSAAAPALDGELGATFSASLTPSKTNAVAKATIQLPNGSTRSLTNTFGFLFFFDRFASQEELDAAYPAGAYTITIQQVSGTAVAQLNMPASAPPTPQFSNFAQLQAFDPTADLTAQWNPFTGATANDSISFDMQDGVASFHAPDPCVPRPLPNTATSILVPKNTFGTGTEIDGSLSFFKFGSSNSNSIPSVVAFSGYSKTTSFKIGESGPNGPEQPELQNFARQANGTVTFEVAGNATSVVVEASSDLNVWTPIATGSLLGGVFNVQDPAAATASQRFYRATAF